MKTKKKTVIGPSRRSKKTAQKKSFGKVKLVLLLVIALALWLRFKPVDLAYPSDGSLKVMEGNPGTRLSKGAQIRQALKDQGTKDSDFIRGEADLLPTDLFILAGNEPESIPFVADYLRGERSSDTRKTLSTLDRTIPYYCQWDSRWGYEDFAGSIFALSGCGPTSMAMVISGLKRDPFMTPDRLIEPASSYMTTEGIGWDFFESISRQYGLKSQVIPLDKSSMNAKLEQGAPLVVSVRPGDFTLGGHIMVIAGLDQEGYYIVNDPNSPRNSQLRWTYERLAPQIKNIWAISK